MRRIEDSDSSDSFSCVEKTNPWEESSAKKSNEKTIIKNVENSKKVRRRIVECDDASESSKEYFSDSDTPTAVVTLKQHKKKKKVCEKRTNHETLDKSEEHEHNSEEVIQIRTQGLPQQVKRLLLEIGELKGDPDNDQTRSTRKTQFLKSALKYSQSKVSLLLCICTETEKPTGDIIAIGDHANTKLYSTEGQAFQKFFLSRRVVNKKMKRRRESKFWIEKKKDIKEKKKNQSKDRNSTSITTDESLPDDIMVSFPSPNVDRTGFGRKIVKNKSTTKEAQHEIGIECFPASSTSSTSLAMSSSAAHRTPFPNGDIAVSSPEVGKRMRKSKGGKQNNVDAIDAGCPSSTTLATTYSKNKSRPTTSGNGSPTHSGMGAGSLRGPFPDENTSCNPAAVPTLSPTRDVNSAGFSSYAPNNRKRTVLQPENKRMIEENKKNESRRFLVESLQRPSGLIVVPPATPDGSVAESSQDEIAENRLKTSASIESGRPSLVLTTSYNVAVRSTPPLQPLHSSTATPPPTPVGLVAGFSPSELGNNRSTSKAGNQNLGSMPSRSTSSIPSATTFSAASRMQPRTGVFFSMIGSDSEEDTVQQPPKRLRLA